MILEGRPRERGSFLFREGQSDGWSIVLSIYFYGCLCTGCWSSEMVLEHIQCQSFLTLWPLHSALSLIGQASGSWQAGTGPGITEAAACKSGKMSPLCLLPGGWRFRTSMIPGLWVWKGRKGEEDGITWGGGELLDNLILPTSTLAPADLSSLLVQQSSLSRVSHPLIYLLICLSLSYTLLNILPEKFYHRQFSHKETVSENLNLEENSKALMLCFTKRVFNLHRMPLHLQITPHSHPSPML